MKKLFQWLALMNDLRVVDPRVADMIGSYYDQLISQGAHPNPLGIQLGSTNTPVGENRFVMTTNFADGSPEATGYALLGLLRTGLYGSELLRLCGPQRLTFLGIDRKLDEISRRVLSEFRGRGIT
jgi:hypothetical protein